ncbi:flagellar hook protein FlgE [Silvimonas iriomotensis]|uniref:Flagellar hook protein FlgE n=1 Tax=Silvimonas iriomotensis TaxID=449662 RepID=A0ABQ2P4N0_9NEIS|nr:flagellar hook protein FlgE [Silvimonas iriomotensis]GGP18258.1 flagellar hook protein FlgE [Silvimonas iriomotensis]
MGFQQGLSGLNAASKNLDVIGNNIANANTVGFKQSRAEFADIYASTFASSSNVAGIGTRVMDVAQQFGQGNVETTSNPLDVAITGNGFFRMSDTSGTISYSRNGQFQLDNQGYIVNDGQRLTGWGVDANTGQLLKGGNPVPLQITVGNIGARATGSSGTSNAGLQVGQMNLNAAATIINRAAPPTGVGPLNVTDPTTFTSSTTAQVYDAQGVSHNLTFYFTKVATNQWEVQTSFDGGTPTTTGSPAGTNGYLMYTGTGTLDATTVPTDPLTGTAASNVSGFTFSTTLTAPNGATSPFAFNVSFPNSTQYGSPFVVNALNQDGYADGTLTGMSIGKDGVIQGSYSNGQTKTVGQIVLANFTNVQGLQPLGDNRWSQTFASGQPTIGDPGTGSLGSLQSSAQEDSNVDLTSELVNLITAQRNYQANAQTIKAQDTILQTIVNLG